MRRVKAWWRSFPWPGVSVRVKVGRSEESFSERNWEEDERMWEGRVQLAVRGDWEVWVVGVVEVANCELRAG